MISWSDFQSKGNKPDHTWIQQKLTGFGVRAQKQFFNQVSNLLLGGEMEHHLFGVLNLITGHYSVFRYVSLSSLKNNSDTPQLIFQVVFLSLKHSIMELSSTLQVCISFCGVFCYFFPEATSPPTPKSKVCPPKWFQKSAQERAACLKGVDWLRVGRAVREKLGRKNWERSFPRLRAWSVVQERV